MLRAESTAVCCPRFADESGNGTAWVQISVPTLSAVGEKNERGFFHVGFPKPTREINKPS